MRIEAKINVNTHTQSLSAVPWAGMLCCVGWDYLCDWISEEGVPQDNTMHSLNTAAAAAPGVCLHKGRSRALKELNVLYGANTCVANATGKW